jgi:hypothetical protein
VGSRIYRRLHFRAFIGNSFRGDSYDCPFEKKVIKIYQQDAESGTKDGKAT